MYKNYCKSSTATKGDQTMTGRDLLWMFKVHCVNGFFFFLKKKCVVTSSVVTNILF